jgi:nucleoside phosphorylase
VSASAAAHHVQDRLGPPRVVVLTALGLEFKAMRATLHTVVESVHSTGTVYDIGTLDTTTGPIRVALAQTGSGNIAAATEVERAISYFQPRIVMFVGVAGRLKDLRLGDVVAATKVYAYGSGKAEGELRTRPMLGQSSYALQQRAQAVARADTWVGRLDPSPAQRPRALVGPIAAGEILLASTSSPVYAFIRDHYGDALAIEMEGYGALAAAFAHPTVSTLVVRGISDLIDGKAAADASGSQERAAAHASAFATEVIAEAISVDLAAGPGAAVENEGRQQNTDNGIDAASDHADHWKRLVALATKLYPTGLQEREVWTRAGGDISMLPVFSNGRTAWYRAIQVLRQGGGGAAITAARLLGVMRDDFPRNAELQQLASQF